MRMEAGKINSVLKRKNSIEGNAIKKQQAQGGNLKERMEKIMNKVIEDYKNLRGLDHVRREEKKALELLGRYGTGSNIPETELDINSSGCDDARLLAMCRIKESEEASQVPEKEKGEMIH